MVARHTMGSKAGCATLNMRQGLPHTMSKLHLDRDLDIVNVPGDGDCGVHVMAVHTLVGAPH